MELYFVAELVGDKLLYATGVLSVRYRSGPVLFRIVVALMLKVAVAVGAAISELPLSSFQSLPVQASSVSRSPYGSSRI
jgi:putative Ca2+/H+ antiporter (TMEM165/GDT1 family)